MGVLAGLDDDEKFPNPNGHSSNANSIMFSVFSGTNIGFDSNDIDLLKSLH